MHKSRFLKLAFAALAAAAAPAAHAITVNAISSTPTVIGAVVAGQAYSVTASGIADLFVGFNGGLGLTFTANGLPTYAFPSPYSAFFPSGRDYDPSQGPSNLGIGGAGRLLGSVLGTFTAAASAPADYFIIGPGTTFTAGTSGSLYAVVNDTFFPDNGGSYSVNLLAVPEPATALMLALGAATLVLHSRRRSISKVS